MSFPWSCSIFEFQWSFKTMGPQNRYLKSLIAKCIYIHIKYCHWKGWFAELNLHYMSVKSHSIQDSKIHGVIMGPTWILSAPDGPHVGPMNPVIRNIIQHQPLFQLSLKTCNTVLGHISRICPWPTVNAHSLFTIYYFMPICPAVDEMLSSAAWIQDISIITQSIFCINPTIYIPQLHCAGKI